MRQRALRPNIVAYNARLKSLQLHNDNDNGDYDNEPESRGSQKQSRRASQKQMRDDAVLRVWDNEIARDPHVVPDKYTIDSLLLPLLRAGRVGDLEALLDQFVQRNSDTVVANAFSAFLLTATRGGELASARALFETYILPTLSPVVTGSAGQTMRLVRPTTRHFTTLLEGYRRRRAERMIRGQRLQMMEDDDDTYHCDSDAEEGWTLYRLMSHGRVQPDAYTITSMMGLCRNSTELSELLVEATSELGISISSVVLRAACEFCLHATLLEVALRKEMFLTSLSFP